MITLRNVSNSTLTAHTEILDPQQEYLIDSSLELWRSDVGVLSNILNSNLLVIVADVEFTNPLEGHDIFLGIDTSVKIVEQPPFSAKILANGYKLFRRKHGYSLTVAANSNLELQINVPYNQCKINKMEILNGAQGDSVDFKVYDTPTGTISTVPNYMLNQFGFGVFLAPDFYVDESHYDADLIKDMKLGIHVYNSSASEKTYYFNIILHEMK